MARLEYLSFTCLAFYELSLTGVIVFCFVFQEYAKEEETLKAVHESVNSVVLILKTDDDPKNNKGNIQYTCYRNDSHLINLHIRHIVTYTLVVTILL